MFKFIVSNLSSVFINLFFLIFLLIGIQNSFENKKVNFLIYESAKIPTSLILGASFISGSLIANFIFSILEIDNKKN